MDLEEFRLRFAHECAKNNVIDPRILENSKKPPRLYDAIMGHPISAVSHMLYIIESLEADDPMAIAWQLMTENAVLRAKCRAMEQQFDRISRILD